MVLGFAIPATAADPIEQQGLVDKARVTFCQQPRIKGFAYKRGQGCSWEIKQ
jgi:hypothetical protein